MKQNLNEQISRIKEIMNLNEEKVDLNTYTDESNIIHDVKRIGTKEELSNLKNMTVTTYNPITSMKINTFVPDANSKEQGQKVSIEIILEWEPTEETKYRVFKNSKLVKEYIIKSLLDIKSDVELDKKMIDFLKKIFFKGNSPYDLVMNIYNPYHQKFGYGNRDILEKGFNNAKEDQKKIEAALSAEPEQQVAPQQVEPEVAHEPEINQEPEKTTDNPIWTSTNSWASE